MIEPGKIPEDSRANQKIQNTASNSGNEVEAAK